VFSLMFIFVLQSYNKVAVDSVLWTCLTLFIALSVAHTLTSLKQ